MPSRGVAVLCLEDRAAAAEVSQDLAQGGLAKAAGCPELFESDRSSGLSQGLQDALWRGDGEWRWRLS